jgi:hypothetical protein
MANTRACIYARVSTLDQHNTVQIRELTEYVERRGWELAGTYEAGFRVLEPRGPGSISSWPTRTVGSLTA